MKRRNFIASLPLMVELGNSFHFEKQWPISSNAYNWQTFYKRQNRNWGTDWERHLKEYATTGLTAIEPSIENPKQALMIINAAKNNNISIPSVYVNSVLHTNESAKSIENVLEIAHIMKTYNTKIFVTNPTPIAWGKSDQKTDEQLMHQAQELEKLGALLKNIGIKLAYHTHDMEMKAGAREFHHTMQNTSEQNVGFCMDVHWIYRGTENSVLPIYDLAKMYHKRIIELHIRQSTGGIWDETFSPNSDINYPKLVNLLKDFGVKPLLVIEQCVEAKTPYTLDAVAAHIIDLKEVKNTFNSLL
jgi:inosose dehydratase